MSVDWGNACISDFVTLQRGNTYKSKLLGLPGPYLLGLASIAREGGFRKNNLKTYGGPTAEKLLLYPDDIYVSLKDVTQSGDLLGSVAKVPPEIEVGRVTQDTVKIEFKNDDIPKSYLYWILRTPQYKTYCRSRAMGTTNLSLSRKDFLSFPVPKINEEREKIVIILEAIEDKIELNNQISQSLEQISQAIFKSWFIDFEPVKAKDHIRKLGGDSAQIKRAVQAIISGTVNLEDIIAGSNLADLDNDIKSKLEAKLGCQTKEQQSKLVETANLFPDKLVESELGVIPEGWKISCLDDEFNFIMGQSPPGDTYNENKIGIPFFQGRRDFGWRYPKNRVYCSKPNKMANIGDTLLSVRAPVGDINLAEIDCCVGRGLAAIRHKSNCGIFTYYSMMGLRRRLKMTYSDGTIFGSINQKVLKSIKVIAPPLAILESFALKLKASENQIQIFEMQSQTLKSIRDALLPKLISGEILLDTEKADLLKVV